MACGVSRTADPDDCFATLLMASTSDVEVVGISTVHGNAPLHRADSVTRGLAALLGRTAHQLRGRTRRTAGP